MLRSLRQISVVLIAIIHFSLQAGAQKAVFTPVIIDSVQLDNLQKGYEKFYQQEIDALPKENKKDLVELYKERWNNVKSKFEKREIYTSLPAQQYLDGLVTEIEKGNPSIPKNEIHCYFSRSGVPNASYIGEGIILFNMGLFDKLENESQVVFVLCHELSHFLLKHSENSIAKYVATLNSKEVQDQLHKIKKSEFGKRELLDNLLKGLTFDSRKHGRNHESQADSMAVELMRNTRFSLPEALRALSLLDSVDMDRFKTEFCLKNMFNAKEYPFQEKWLMKEEGLLGGHASLAEDNVLADSLKTHPDCGVRVKYLEPFVKAYAKNNSLLVNTDKFIDIQKTFRFEVVEYAFVNNNYARSLHYSIGLLQDNPADPYLVAQVGKIFNALYKADKEHTLNKVTDLPSPYADPNYNMLLQFIQNLYRENFAAINYHYLAQYQTTLDTYPPYRSAYKLSAQIIRQ